MDEARQALDELISSRKGCTYSGISRLLGRNVSYIQPVSYTHLTLPPSDLV